MPLIYIGIKVAIYFLWCWYGMRVLTPMHSVSLLRAFALALARLALGFGLGVCWTFLLARLSTDSEFTRVGFDPKHFFMGLLVLRWLVWSVVSYLIRLPSGVPSPLGVSLEDWLWRLGGVGLSFLADILVLIGVVGVYGIVC